MRAARLLSLVLLLQNRGSMTGPQLAEELGVSERTIARDAVELVEAGIPVYAGRGRAGGYRLVDGFRTRLTGLGRDEVAALFLSGAPDALRGMGMTDAAQAAKLKLGAALGATVRDAPSQVTRRFHLDAPGWFRQAEVPELLPVLSRAVWEDRTVRVRYVRGRRLSETGSPAEVERLLVPYGLVLKAGVWYLVAESEQEFRTYRVDRFTGMELTEDTFSRDEDFELARFWRERSEQFSLSLLHDEITIRLTPAGVQRLPHVVEPVVGRTALAQAPPPEPDGRVTVVLAVESIAVAYTEMLALGPEVEILAPPELRARFGEAAEIMYRRYR